MSRWLPPRLMFTGDAGTADGALAAAAGLAAQAAAASLIDRVLAGADREAASRRAAQVAGMLEPSAFVALSLGLAQGLHTMRQDGDAQSAARQALRMLQVVAVGMERVQVDAEVALTWLKAQRNRFIEMDSDESFSDGAGQGDAQADFNTGLADAGLDQHTDNAVATFLSEVLDGNEQVVAKILQRARCGGRRGQREKTVAQMLLEKCAANTESAPRPKHSAAPGFWNGTLQGWVATSSVDRTEQRAPPSSAPSAHSGRRRSRSVAQAVGRREGAHPADRRVRLRRRETGRLRKDRAQGRCVAVGARACSSCMRLSFQARIVRCSPTAELRPTDHWPPTASQSFQRLAQAIWPGVRGAEHFFGDHEKARGAADAASGAVLWVRRGESQRRTPCTPLPTPPARRALPHCLFCA